MPPVRRCHIVGDVRESRFVGASIRISEHGYIDAADRCCLRPTVFNVKPAISLTFTAATRLSFHQQSLVTVVTVCVHLPSCPGHACVREGWGAGGFELCKRNNPVIQCLLTVRKQFKSSILRSYHVGRWIVNEITWKTVPKPRISVFWKPNRRNRVFGFWILRSVRFGSVRFLENRYPKLSSDSAHPYNVCAFMKFTEHFQLLNANNFFTQTVNQKHQAKQHTCDCSHEGKLQLQTWPSVVATRLRRQLTEDQEVHMTSLQLVNHLVWWTTLVKYDSP